MITTTDVVDEYPGKRALDRVSRTLPASSTTACDQPRADAAAGVYRFVLYALLPGLLQTSAALDFARRPWARLPA